MKTSRNLSSALQQTWQGLWKWLKTWVGRPAVTRAEPVRALESATAPRACATVVIPALNEAARIAQVVSYALSDPATAEVIVVDDSSIDETAQLALEAGARVITSTMLGKGASMKDGLKASRCDVLVYLDGDLTGLRPGIVTDLCQPLVQQRADFVKARFGRGGGRVTELTAKPMLKVFFPELARFEQPLGGLIAGRKTLLSALDFEDGYGVDIGLLIDAYRSGARLLEVDIGSLEHDSQPLLDLTAMANEVSRVIFARARAAGRLHMEQITAMYETQRQATATVTYILGRRRGRTRVLLLDMDGAVSTVPFIDALAEAAGARDALEAMRQQRPEDGAGLGVRAAELFRFMHRNRFEQLAHELPLRPGVVAWVNQMRRQGFMVGVVSSSYFVAAEILRRRVFADFAIAHTLQFDGDVCTGECKANEAFMPSKPAISVRLDKRHVVERFRSDDRAPAVETVWAVGHHPDSAALLREADRAWVVASPSRRLARECDATDIASFEDLLAQTLMPKA